MKCLGIPVYLDPNGAMISDSRGVWPFKRIVLGRSFQLFDPEEKKAIILHEVAHCKLFHLERRILRAIFAPWGLVKCCHEQEFQADFFVGLLGHGPDLARAFAKLQSVSDPLHPPTSERIKRLLAWPSKV